MENKIFVIYLGIAGVRSEDIDDFKYEVTKRIIPESVEGEFIVIPVHSTDTRIECINPVYITDKELIEKHTVLMKDLQLALKNEIDQIKKTNE